MSFDLKIVRGDLAIQTNGDIKPIFGNDKLKQDIIKILMTETGENKFHPEYGSAVGALKIGSIPDEELLVQDLSASAESAIKRLISLQRSQMRRQFLSPGEIIVDLLDVSVQRDVNDPRVYNIFVSVITQELTPITESIPIRVF